jgi:hypothetical protein
VVSIRSSGSLCLRDDLRCGTCERRVRDGVAREEWDWARLSMRGGQLARRGEMEPSPLYGARRVLIRITRPALSGVGAFGEGSRRLPFQLCRSGSG